MVIIRWQWIGLASWCLSSPFIEGVNKNDLFEIFLDMFDKHCLFVEILCYATATWQTGMRGLDLEMRRLQQKRSSPCSKWGWAGPTRPVEPSPLQHVEKHLLSKNDEIEMQNINKIYNKEPETNKNAGKKEIPLTKERQHPQNLISVVLIYKGE